jgi:hypothetical protein
VPAEDHRAGGGDELTAAGQDFKMYAGQYVVVQFHVVNEEDGSPIDFSDTTIVWTMWMHTKVETVRLTKTNSDGITVTSVENGGIVTLIIQSPDTEGFPPGTYKHGLACSVDGGWYPLSEGRVAVRPKFWTAPAP